MVENLDSNIIFQNYKIQVVYIFFSLFHSHSKLGQLYENIFNGFLHYKTIIFLVLGVKINVFVEMTSIVGGIRFWNTGALFSLGLRTVKARQRSDFGFYYLIKCVYMLGVVVLALNSSIQRTEAGESLWVKISLVCIVRLSQNKRTFFQGFFDI